ncbi:hypothetical protein MTO96_042114 [Rhipicephalus appendiculatus]
MGASAFVLFYHLPCKTRLYGEGHASSPYFTAVPAECLLPLRFVSSLGEFSGLSDSTPYLQPLRQARALQQDVPAVG